jgi:hypothetical protein
VALADSGASAATLERYLDERRVRRQRR